MKQSPKKIVDQRSTRNRRKRCGKGEIDRWWEKAAGATRTSSSERGRRKRRKKRRYEAEDERSRYVSFVVATKGPPGGFANRNRRPWSVYEFPQLGTGDKQIASYFCIQRLNGRRVWNDAAVRYRPTIIGEPTSTSEEFQRAVALPCVIVLADETAPSSPSPCPSLLALPFRKISPGLRCVQWTFFSSQTSSPLLRQRRHLGLRKNKRSRKKQGDDYWRIRRGFLVCGELRGWLSKLCEKFLVRDGWWSKIRGW